MVFSVPEQCLNPCSTARNKIMEEICETISEREEIPAIENSLV